MPMRNIEKTAPYFHDGSVADLGEAIKIMGETELMKALTDQQVAEIETVLNTLTGEIPKEALLTQAQ
jgi:cytochrome c peroxidase